MKVNYHTHTTISDGKLSPENLIKLAIKKKFSILGITDHYRFPKGFRSWGTKRYLDKNYNELKSLQKRYSNKIKILINVEFDWFPEYKKWIINESKKRKYDYKFVSIHFLKVGKDYFPIDHDEKTLKKIIDKIGSAKKVVKLYYKNLRQGIKTSCFDVVGHLDIIKTYNKNKKYFSYNEKWYQKEVYKTLKLIKKKNMLLDLNTKGLRKPCAEQYPSLEILRQAKDMGIKYLIGTDAHSGEELEFGFDKIDKFKN